MLNSNKLFIFIFIFSISFSAYSETKLIQIVIDNSGILHDEDDPRGKTSFDKFVGNFLYEVSRKHRRERAETNIRIISSTHPPRTIWTGTASNFARKGLKSSEVLELLVNKTGCNDIPTALDDALITKSITNAKSNIIYVITSGVHSGSNCDEMTQEGYVKLLQNVDEQLMVKLVEVATEFNTLSIQFLTSTQRRLFYSSLTDSGLGNNLASQGQSPQLY